MERIQDLSQYKELIKSVKGLSSKIRTNSLMLPKTAETLIRENRLSYESHPGGIYLFTDEGNYRKLFYHWTEEPLEKPLTGDPLIAEEIDSNGRRAEELEKTRRELEGIGFTVRKISDRFELKPEEEMIRNVREQLRTLEESYQGEFRIGVCRRDEHYGEVMKLWKDHLDIYDFTEEHYRFEDPVCRPLIVLNRGGEAVSVLWTSLAGFRGEAYHLATRPDCRRRGLALYLFDRWITDSYDSGAKYLDTWVSRDNLKSVQLHEKTGFTRTGKTSIQFFKEGER